MVKEKEQLHYEQIFRTYLRLLADTATNEYRFLLRFFNRRDMFNYIFEPVLKMFLEEFEAFKNDSWDPLGLLLMIRLIELSQGEMIERKVACLEPFFDKVKLPPPFARPPKLGTYACQYAG